MSERRIISAKESKDLANKVMEDIQKSLTEERRKDFASFVDEFRDLPNNIVRELFLLKQIHSLRKEILELKEQLSHHITKGRFPLVAKDDIQIITDRPVGRTAPVFNPPIEPSSPPRFPKPHPDVT